MLSRAGHLLKRVHHLQLAGGFTSQPDETSEMSRPQLGESKFEHAASFAIASGGFKKKNIDT